MKSILAQLRAHVTAALATAFGADAEGADPLVKPAGDPKFGDYQCNVAMGLAKKLGCKPRDVAQQVIDALPAEATDMLAPPEIAGPGFVNLRLKNDYLSSTLTAIPPAPDAADEDHLGIEAVTGDDRQTVVIDYSSPNVAKQMHVGHLRSTIIGDTIARVIEFEGHKVERQNHLGDWGTQFGMVILGLWHLCMGRRHGKSPKDFEGRVQFLGSAVDPSEKHEVLREISETHQHDLDEDPDGKIYFAPFVEHWEPRFDEALPMYKFVTVVEKTAGEFQDLHVDHPRWGRKHLSELSKHVAAMLQDVDSVSGENQDWSNQEYLAWKKAVQATCTECDALYGRLGLSLSHSHYRGESFYNSLLAGVAEELLATLQSPERERRGDDTEKSSTDDRPLAGARGSDGGFMRAICREDQGALCVFLEKPDGTPAFKNPQGDPLPMIIQKSDGAFLYSTTDLAAIAYRVNDVPRQPISFETQTLPNALRTSLEADGLDPNAASRGGLGADRILYVVGSPQKLHFQMLFATVGALGWTRPGDGSREVQLEHVSFGSVLGADRKMLKTRTGDNVKLKDLLDEAVQRAEKLVRDTEADPAKRRGFDEEEIQQIADTVGIAAVKYADLCQNRNTDYVFSWDKMLALQGNTAPYMLYAYARIRSIYRKGAEAAQVAISDRQSAISLDHAAERELALAVLRLAETLDAVADSLLPNILCEYLYDLAGRFMTFYESCPVLKAPDDATRLSRLRLCAVTARTLKLGLGLLGIQTLERM